MMEMIEANVNDSFWRHVGLIFQQYRGNRGVRIFQFLILRF